MDSEGLDLPSSQEQPQQKTDSCKTQYFSRHWDSGNKGQWSLWRQETNKVSCLIAPASCWEKVFRPQGSEGKSNQSPADSPPQVKETELGVCLWRPKGSEFTGQRIREESCRENPRDLRRVPLKQAAEYWSTHECKENYPRPGEKQSKSIREHCLAGIGPRRVPIPTSQTGNLITHRALGRVPKKFPTHLTNYESEPKRIKLTPSYLTASQNKAHEYLEEYKYIQHTTR